jgi:hypothetical protein
MKPPKNTDDLTKEWFAMTKKNMRGYLSLAKQHPHIPEYEQYAIQLFRIRLGVLRDGSLFKD